MVKYILLYQNVPKCHIRHSTCYEQQSKDTQPIEMYCHAQNVVNLNAYIKKTHFVCVCVWLMFLCLGQTKRCLTTVNTVIPHSYKSLPRSACLNKKASRELLVILNWNIPDLVQMFSLHEVLWRRQPNFKRCGVRGRIGKRFIKCKVCVHLPRYIALLCFFFCKIC